MKKRILTTFKDGDHAVIWSTTGKQSHCVQYGQHVKEFTGINSDLDACAEFGECVRHSLECASKFYE